jgi:hypothetical protein
MSGQLQLVLPANQCWNTDGLRIAIEQIVKR